jgi:hypothetical protein
MDTKNLQPILDELVKEQNIFDQLKTDFPEILADLTTYRTNPNCSCRGRVTKFFQNKLKENEDLLNKYVTDDILVKAQDNSKKNEKNNVTEQPVPQSNQAAFDPNNNYAGRIFYVDKTEVAWGAFVKGLNGKFFKSFSVTERTDKVVVYFI